MFFDRLALVASGGRQLLNKAVPSTHRTLCKGRLVDSKIRFKNNNTFNLINDNGHRWDALEKNAYVLLTKTRGYITNGRISNGIELSKRKPGRDTYQ